MCGACDGARRGDACGEGYGGRRDDGAAGCCDACGEAGCGWPCGWPCGEAGFANACGGECGCACCSCEGEAADGAAPRAARSRAAGAHAARLGLTASVGLAARSLPLDASATAASSGAAGGNVANAGTGGLEEPDSARRRSAGATAARPPGGRDAAEADGEAAACCGKWAAARSATAWRRNGCDQNSSKAKRCEAGAEGESNGAADSGGHANRCRSASVRARGVVGRVRAKGEHLWGRVRVGAPASGLGGGVPTEAMSTRPSRASAASPRGSQYS